MEEEIKKLNDIIHDLSTKYSFKEIELSNVIGKYNICKNIQRVCVRKHVR